MRTRLFLEAARVASALPHFRGKTRLLLALYRALGLAGRSIVAWTRLRRPVPFRARLDLQSWLQRVAFITGGYEGDTVRFLMQLHDLDGRSGYLLDVGANVGLIAIPFAIATGRDVYAAEAVPDNVAALRVNIEANRLDPSARVLPFALGERSGTAQIQVEGNLRAGEGTGTANVLPDGSTYECVRQEITVRTLDALVGEGTLPTGCSVVKIDTDGYDLNILRGGTNFLERDRPIIFGEFSAHCLRWHNQTIEDVIAFASGVGYEVWFRAGRSWKFSETPVDPFVQDALLVPSERKSDYRRLLC